MDRFWAISDRWTDNTAPHAIYGDFANRYTSSEQVIV